MALQLPVSRLISVQTNLFTSAGQFQNFAAAMIVGQTDGIINVSERYRTYTSLTAVGSDFGTTAPEYLAAQTFFAAKPQPAQVMIGRWAQTATHGLLVGGDLVGSQLTLSNFTTITTGSLKISVNGGAAQEVDSINFSSASNLNGVASTLTTALANASVNCSCVWTGTNFKLVTFLTGSSASISFPSTPSTGVNIASALGLNASNGAYTVAGINAESALAAAQAIDSVTPFYWLSFSASPSLQASDMQAIAQWVEGSSTPHAYSLTTSDANALNPLSSADIGSILNGLSLTRTFGQWSSTNPYADCGIMGIGVGINWLGSNTVINFMYQPEPGVTAENLNINQANALDAKNYNYVASYSNGSTVLENGNMFGTDYIDERVGADWLANYIQTNLFDFLSSVGTKVAQTDQGIHTMYNNIAASMNQSVKNGLVAPGVWNAAGFGQLNEGDTLPTGWYIYVPPIASQSATTRAQRISPTFQVAAKLAGAVNKANVILNFSR